MGQLKITILGCGASGGVPAIGNNWGECDPTNPRNNRMRSSISIQSENTTIVVDTGPDFRHQINRANISKIDAILYTHAHGDHVAGIDELRAFQRRYKKAIPVYSNQVTIDKLSRQFDYMFKDISNGFYPKVLDPYIFKDTDYTLPQTIGDINFVPVEQDHATCISLGFRFGNIGYSTDMINLSDESISAFKGIDTWIVDGAGYFYDPITVHANVPRLLELNEKIGAKKIYLTHMSLMMDFEDMLKRLPDGFYPCYDGLEFLTDNIL